MIKTSHIAKSVDVLKSFLAQTIQYAQFELNEITMDQQDQWSFKDGVLVHKSNGFFQVTGYKDHTSTLERLMLYQPQGAFNGLLVHKSNDGIFVMVQARIEPGNVGIGQYGPTVQSTPANYLRMHGGKATPFLEYFFEYRSDARLVSNSTQLDLGEIYYQKTKKLCFVETNELIPTSDQMIWVELSALFDLAQHDHLVNTDLRSMLGVFDWQAYGGTNEEETAPAALANLYRCIGQQVNLSGGITSIEALNGWHINDLGVADLGGSGVSVQMYKTHSTTREVESWVQPLMRIRHNAGFTLCIRESDGEKQVLIGVKTELGVDGGKVAMPSFGCYTGTNDYNANHTLENLARVEQSEEGGRFYRSTSIYDVVHVVPDMPISKHQFWLTLSEFKQLLKTSNTVGIQLRCMASLILKTLNSGWNEPHGK